jgi:hypothetical protein
MAADATRDNTAGNRRMHSSQTMGGREQGKWEKTVPNCRFGAPATRRDRQAGTLFQLVFSSLPKSFGSRTGRVNREERRTGGRTGRVSEAAGACFRWCSQSPERFESNAILRCFTTEDTENTETEGEGFPDPDPNPSHSGPGSVSSVSSVVHPSGCAGFTQMPVSSAKPNRSVL